VNTAFALVNYFVDLMLNSIDKWFKSRVAACFYVFDLPEKTLSFNPSLILLFL